MQPVMTSHDALVRQTVRHLDVETHPRCLPEYASILHSTFGYIEHRVTRTRTTNANMIATAIDSAVAAFDSLAILVTDPAVSGHSPAALQVLVDDRPLTIPITALAYCTGQRDRQLVAEYEPSEGCSPS